MGRWCKKQWTGCVKIITVAVIMAFLLSTQGIAAENAITPSDSTGRDVAISSEAVEDRGILSVELPVVTEGKPSPFDFILDPDGLLYETSAMRYGGGKVEEGATMLFDNEEGEYAFSACSDRLTVTNRSGETVIVTVSASVSDLEEIELVGQNDFTGNENPAIYLAIIDDRGKEQPIPEDGETIIRTELDPGGYSFGLTGACNPDAEWQEAFVHPKVTVTWSVESVPAEVKEMPDIEADHPEEKGTEETSAQEDFGKTQEDNAIFIDSEPGVEPDRGSGIEPGSEADGEAGLGPDGGPGVEPGNEADMESDKGTDGELDGGADRISDGAMEANGADNVNNEDSADNVDSDTAASNHPTENDKTQEQNNSGDTPGEVESLEDFTDDTGIENDVKNIEKNNSDSMDIDEKKESSSETAKQKPDKYREGTKCTLT